MLMESLKRCQVSKRILKICVWIDWKQVLLWLRDRRGKRFECLFGSLCDLSSVALCRVDPSLSPSSFFCHCFFASLQMFTSISASPVSHLSTPPTSHLSLTSLPLTSLQSGSAWCSIMTDGEGRARFQYAECPEGQEQEEVQEEVRLAIPTPYRKDAPGHDGDTGGGHDEEEDEEEVERHRRDSSGRGGGGGQWSPEVQEHEDQEPELEVGPTLGVRITAPIRDPDCVSEEEEQQPYPALAPVAFFCLKQTTRPRNWCLRIVCNPYPFIFWKPYPVWRLVRPNMSSVLYVWVLPLLPTSLE